MPNELATRTIWAMNGHASIAPPTRNGFGRQAYSPRSHRVALLSRGTRPVHPNVVGSSFGISGANAQTQRVLRDAGLHAGSDYQPTPGGLALSPSGYQKLQAIAQKCNAAARRLLSNAREIEKRASLEREPGRQAHLLGVAEQAFSCARDAQRVASGLASLTMEGAGLGNPIIIGGAIVSLLTVGLAFLGWGPTEDFMNYVSQQAKETARGFFDVIQFAIYVAAAFGSIYVWNEWVSPLIEGYRAGKTSFKSAFWAGKGRRRLRPSRSGRGLPARKRPGAFPPATAQAETDEYEDDLFEPRMEEIVNKDERAQAKNMLQCLRKAIKSSENNRTKRFWSLDEWVRARKEGGSRSLTAEMKLNYDRCVTATAQAYKNRTGRKMPANIRPPYWAGPGGRTPGRKKEFSRIFELVSGRPWSDRLGPNPWRHADVWLPEGT